MHHKNDIININQVNAQGHTMFDGHNTTITPVVMSHPQWCNCIPH